MTHFYTRYSFIIGLMLGVILAVIIKHRSVIKQNHSVRSPNSNLYQKWFNKTGLKRQRVSWDHLRYSNATYFTESQYLFDRIKVLCVVLVKTPSNFEALNDTWTKGCNKITPIMLDAKKKIMPTKRDKEKSSWFLLCNLLIDIDPKGIDWIFVARDTSFVIMENFRLYVAPLDSTKEHYLGHAVKFWSTVYNSGDPGYALSIGTIKMFQKHINRQKCSENNYRNREDFYLGNHLAKLNITPVNTLDGQGLSTFYPHTWYHVFYPGDSYYQNSVFPVQCCSPRSIAFHATEGDKMYTFHYMLYKLQIFTGGEIGNRPFKDLVAEDKPWKQFLKEQNIRDDTINSSEYYKLWENVVNDPDSFARNLRKEQEQDYE